jgi:hypothetical protein
VTGKRLLKRILLTLAATAGFFMLAFVIQAQAMPIRPDLQKLLAQPQEATSQFAPARAGWQGPEISRTEPQRGPAATLLDQSATAKSMRATLVAAAIPDPRLLLLVVLAIFALRRLRQHQRPQPEAVPEENPLQKAA